MPLLKCGRGRSQVQLELGGHQAAAAEVHADCGAFAGRVKEAASDCAELFFAEFVGGWLWDDHVEVGGVVNDHADLGAAGKGRAKEAFNGGFWVAQESCAESWFSVGTGCDEFTKLSVGDLHMVRNVRVGLLVWFRKMVTVKWNSTCAAFIIGVYRANLPSQFIMR